MKSLAAEGRTVFVSSHLISELAINGDKGVQLWDVAFGRQTGRSLSAGRTTGGPIDSVAFSPDGTMLATGSDIGMQLWEVATGDQLASLSVGQINSVAFSPDGTTLATGGTALWDVSYLTDPLARLCAQAGGSLTPADWSRYVQAGTPYQNACH
jgi:WD40 repeat protein